MPSKSIFIACAKKSNPVAPRSSPCEAWAIAWNRKTTTTPWSRELAGVLASMLIDPQVLKETDTPSTEGKAFLGLFKRKQNNRALLNKIMVWMFGPLFLLWTIGLVITYFIAQNIANATYDRPLADHLRLLKHGRASCRESASPYV